MRQRLSWNKEKVAEISKQADPYTMNQERQNPPVEKYKLPDTSFGEEVNMAHPWEGEGRTETGHPAPSNGPAVAPVAAPEAPVAAPAAAPAMDPAQAPAREAVVAARKLEDKALKCLTIAQRMLPCASEEALEEQATDLMYMPENAIMATLQRQASLAEKLSAKEEPKKPETEETEEVPAVTPAAPVAPAKAPAKEAAEEVAPVAPAAAPAAVPAEEPKKDKEDKKEEPKDVEASEEADLLDQLFANTEVTAATKAGAKKLSGIVKQASSSSDTLDNIWDCPPDISKAF